MLHKRQKKVNDFFRILSFSNLTLQKVSSSYNINRTELEIILCIEAFQQERNKLITLDHLVLRSGYSRTTVCRGLRPLLRLQYIDRILMKDNSMGCSEERLNHYNVTYTGALIVKQVNMELSRMVNETKNSEWLRIQAQDEKVKQFLAPLQGTVQYKKKKKTDRRLRKRDVLSKKRTDS